MLAFLLVLSMQRSFSSLGKHADGNVHDHLNFHSKYEAIHSHKLINSSRSCGQLYESVKNLLPKSLLAFAEATPLQHGMFGHVHAGTGEVLAGHLASKAAGFIWQ